MAKPAVQDIASEIGTLLKVHYGDAIVEQTNMTPMAWKLFDNGNNETFAGDHFEFPARMIFPQSIGPRAYRGVLPPPGLSTDVTTKVFHKYLYATFDIPGPDMERARNRQDAFVVGLTDRMNALVKSFLKDCNFQTYLSGTGLYATIVGLAGATNTVDVDRSKFLRVGRRIDWWDDSAVALGFGSANVKTAALFQSIIGIDPKGGAIVSGKQSARVTLNTVRTTLFAAIATGDSIVPETGLSTGSAAVGIFLNGLGAIVDDSTEVNVFQGINRTTFPQWKATIFGNAGSPQDLTLQLMQLLVDVPEAQSGLEVDLLMGSYNARNQYLQLLVSQKRFMADSLDGGFRSLDFNGKKFLVDVDCPDDTVFGLHRAAIKRFGLFEPRFDDSDGNVLKYTAQQGDTFEGFLKMYGNLGTDQSNAHGKITDLTINSGYLVAA
jgi:hypothetical protein